VDSRGVFPFKKVLGLNSVGSGSNRAISTRWERRRLPGDLRTERSLAAATTPFATSALSRASTLAFSQD
jgi:hypothetical protein